MSIAVFKNPATFPHPDLDQSSLRIPIVFF